MSKVQEDKKYKKVGEMTPKRPEKREVKSKIDDLCWLNGYNQACDDYEKWLLDIGIAEGNRVPTNFDILKYVLKEQYEKTRKTK
jgi:hypothetical protein